MIGSLLEPAIYIDGAFTYFVNCSLVVACYFSKITVDHKQETHERNATIKQKQGAYKACCESLIIHVKYGRMSFDGAAKIRNHLNKLMAMGDL